MNTQPVTPMPAFPPPKISGQGVVYKKDGTVSKPEEPKEKEDGRNSDNRSA